MAGSILDGRSPDQWLSIKKEKEEISPKRTLELLLWADTGNRRPRNEASVNVDIGGTTQQRILRIILDLGLHEPKEFQSVLSEVWGQAWMKLTLR
jgi:hypothetical protein